MIGNGRPFVLEIINAQNDATESNLSQIVDLLQSKQGLNSFGDINVSWLKKVSFYSILSIQFINNSNYFNTYSFLLHFNSFYSSYSFSKVDKSVWENMQGMAEEKKKAYCCIVWTENAYTKEQIEMIQQISSAKNGINIDDENRNCLEVTLYQILFSICL